MIDDDLILQAERLGIATSYVDGDDNERPASTRALRAVVDLLGRRGADGRWDGADPFDAVVLVRRGRWDRGVAPRFDAGVDIAVELEDGATIGPHRIDGRPRLDHLVPAASLPIGIHRLRWSRVGQYSEEQEATLLVAPASMSVPARDRAGLGLFAPAYALWSEAEPLPSYDNLAGLGAATVDLGVDTIATLPLYSPGFGDRFASSPYSPLSRFHWNELLVPDRLLGGNQIAGIDVPLAEDRIDWDVVTRTRAGQLDAVASRLTPADGAELADFLAVRPDVVLFARYAAGGDELLARRHEIGQWLAERSLSEVVGQLETNGQRLALDLPVGARRDSWDCARWPDVHVDGASIGAPPDEFFAAGQTWDLPPVDPIASRIDGHRMWHELLSTACRYPDVLRIDHVMQVFRLWWVPDGHDPADGVYVHYPADELLAIAAIVAHRTNTILVGENLGIVPPAVEELLADWGMVGMYMERFTMHDWTGTKLPGTRRRLPPVPSGTWASIRTHDMPPLAAEAVELDLDLYREALGAELARPVAGDLEALARAMIERLLASSAYEVVVDLDDVIGVDMPHNRPGIVDGSNWTRRLGIGIDGLGSEPRFRRVLSPRA